LCDEREFSPSLPRLFPAHDLCVGRMRLALLPDSTVEATSGTIWAFGVGPSIGAFDVADFHVDSAHVSISSLHGQGLVRSHIG
jgi:hypothetical protein